ncbi:hypothetical protein IAT38_001647 [Cryptococcus sp. DSM 104549]
MSESTPIAPIPIPGSSSEAHPTLASSSSSDPATLTSLESRRKSTVSPPIDPSKLNNLPAPLPPAPAPSSGDEARSPPRRSSVGDARSPPTDSAYLDTGAPAEPASHPTIAETGVLASNGEAGPGPRQGQLKRVEKKSDGEIIKLGSLGGDGLKLKPVGKDDEF